MDSIGRILVEFCFFRTAAVKMIWPDHSDQDITARRVFNDRIMPRPLMRYFLVSVRGSIDDLDGFRSPSMLFCDRPEEYAVLKHSVHELLDEFKGPFGSGESAVDWNGVYDDRRLQGMTLELIESLRRKVEEFGLEQYVAQLERYRDLDPEKSGLNAMHRSFGIDDGRQIADALEVAEAALWQMTH